MAILSSAVVSLSSLPCVLKWVCLQEGQAMTLTKFVSIVNVVGSRTTRRLAMSHLSDQR